MMVGGFGGFESWRKDEPYDAFRERMQLGGERETDAIPDGSVLSVGPVAVQMIVGGKHVSPGQSVICDRVNGKWIAR